MKRVNGEYGPYVNAEDNNEQAPMHLTAIRDSKETAIIPIYHGAIVNKTDNQKFTPSFCST